MSSLQDPLGSSILGHTWRTMLQYFNNKDGQLAGCLEFSPARHQLGHSVSYMGLIFATTPCLNRPVMTCPQSLDLDTESGYQWLADMTFPASIILGALCIMHPQLYDAGMHGIELLDDWSCKNDPRMQRALCRWPTVFTNVSDIANQCTPLHRDPHSRSSWYDVLVNVRDFDHCVLDLPTLGIELLYRPGTVAAFSGRLLSVTTMSNSGSYPVTPVASQLYSSTPVVHHLLRSWSRRYTSVKYDPWPSPYSVLTTPHRLPCLDVSSPCTCYIHHLVSFSPDLFYFTWA